MKRFKPTSPGRRFQVRSDRREITKKKPEKSLTVVLKKKSGRARGKISTRHKGGREKRLYREIDFKRGRIDVPAKVLAIEYDPNRSAQIALLEYAGGGRAYILAPNELKVDQEVLSSEKAEIKPGNALPLRQIPLGTIIHNVELTPGKGAQLARSAGTSVKLMAREKGWAHLRLSSGELRLVSEAAWATIGQVGNLNHGLVKLGKAGASRHRGIRPNVRGTAMPAGEHPHGGGEGRTGTGRPSKTYKGKSAKGKKTRNRKKLSSKYILQRRK